MRLANIILALVSFATGLWAAYKWYLASIVRLDLGYTYFGGARTYMRAGILLTRQAEPTDESMKRENEISATWDAINQASNLNKIAAFWTAGSVGFAAAASIIGALSS